MSSRTNGAQAVLGAGDGGGARGKTSYSGGCPRPRLGFHRGSQCRTEPRKTVEPQRRRRQSFSPPQTAAMLGLAAGPRGAPRHGGRRGRVGRTARAYGRARTGRRRPQEAALRHKDGGGGGGGRGKIRQPDGVRKEEERPDLAKFWPTRTPYIYTWDDL